MEGLRVATFTTMAVLVLLVTLVFPAIINAQSPEPSMAPSPSPSNDGVAIDQGIAYVLMVAALVVTYIMH